MDKIAPYQVFKHALFETSCFFGLNRRSLVVPAIPAAGLILDWYQRGWSKMLEEWHILLTYTVLPLVAFIVVLFLCNLWLAPFRLLAAGIDTHQSAGAKIDINPTHDDWVHVENLRVWQAACIFKNVNPEWPLEMSDPVFPIILTLEEAISTNDIEAIRKSENRPGWSQISRDEFISYCDKKFSSLPDLYMRENLYSEGEKGNGEG